MPLFDPFSALHCWDKGKKKEGGKHVFRASIPPKLCAVIPTKFAHSFNFWFGISIAQSSKFS